MLKYKLLRVNWYSLQIIFMELVMKFTRKLIGISKMLFLIVPFIISCNAKSQVDQRWLNSWNEANNVEWFDKWMNKANHSL